MDRQNRKQRLRPSYEAPDDFQEGYGDFQLKSIPRPILYSTDWTSGTAVNQIKRRIIDLDPRFQRRDAWSGADKSKFIESLVLHIPIPQIILAEHPSSKGKYIVIDGKQRLLTLVQFLLPEEDRLGKYDKLKLSSLNERKDLNGKYFDEIRDTEDGSAIENSVIRTVIINGVKDENFLYEVFLRLNTLGKSLSPQELRQALAPGPFTDFLDDFASESLAIQQALNIDKPDRRMRDNELLLRFIAFKTNLVGYDGDFKRFMDNTTRTGNNEWEQHSPRYYGVVNDLTSAITLTFDIFQKNSFQLFEQGRYSGRFNRAVFDIMTYFFADESIREAAVGNEDEIAKSFKSLCEEDATFRSQFSVNTKEVSNVFIRYSRWAEKLGEAVGKDLRAFSYDEARNRVALK